MTVEQARKPIGIGLDVVARCVLSMLSVCKVCSTDHVARMYRHTTRPNHRAWTVLNHLRTQDYIETEKSIAKVAVHRLSKRIRQKYQLPVARWDGHIGHRLAITDVYMDLDSPTDFIVEPRREFMWRNQHFTLSPDAYTNGMFIEVQRSPMKAKQWERKRRMYELYFGARLWQQDFNTAPMVVIVQTHNQQPQTIGAGIGYDLRIVNHICEVM